MLDLKYTLFFDSGKVLYVDNIYRFICQYDICLFAVDMRFSSDVNIPVLNYYYNTRKERVVDRFYVYNENGVMISPELMYTEVVKEYNKERPVWWHGKLHYNAYNWFRYRRRKSHTNRRYKTPKTQQERRKNHPVLEDGEPPIRAKRSPSNLRTHWDDVHQRHSCSWKSTKRKHQYKDK